MKEVRKGSDHQDNYYPTSKFVVSLVAEYNSHLTVHLAQKCHPHVIDEIWMEKNKKMKSSKCVSLCASAIHTENAVDSVL